MGIASENWRVRKGDVFKVSAVQPITTKSNLNYSWTVSNGKILSGQDTANLEIKAGGIKTGGFINVSGFVEIRVTVEMMENGRRCSLDASTKIMVGRHRESNGFADVEELVLDEDKLSPICPQGQVAADGRRSDDMIIDVSTLAKDPENDVLSYNYSVSAGKIVGVGSKVKWDLTGAVPGTYTIDAGVDDGFGIFGRTQRRTVTITDCILSCGLCSCPEISISGPESISDSITSRFTAIVSGGSQSGISYDWTVVNGEIIDGQGTPSITVRLPLNGSDKLNSISLTIGGIDPMCNCLTKNSKLYENGRLKP